MPEMQSIAWLSHSNQGTAGQSVKAVQLGTCERILLTRIWKSQFSGSYGIKLSDLGCELCSMWMFLVRAYPYGDQGEMPNSDKQPRFRGAVNVVGKHV
jgi:hypothetical protein